VHAQIKDSVINATIISTSYGFQVPGSDMAQRFGNNGAIGGSILYKTKKNWCIGITGAFLFGSNVKEDVLQSIRTSEGEIISQTGEYADVLLLERGLTFNGNISKIVPILSPNPNSGLMIRGGIGLLQHKIRIENQNDVVPQLSSEHKKGYDRLSNGLAFTEFIGYILFSNSRFLNLFAGFEFTQAFTKNRRTFNYDTQEKDNNTRKDLLYGIKIGWMIPIYKKSPDEYYYY